MISSRPFCVSRNTNKLLQQFLCKSAKNFMLIIGSAPVKFFYFIFLLKTKESASLAWLFLHTGRWPACIESVFYWICGSRIFSLETLPYGKRTTWHRGRRGYNEKNTQNSNGDCKHSQKQLLGTAVLRRKPRISFYARRETRGKITKKAWFLHVPVLQCLTNPSDMLFKSGRQSQLPQCSREQAIFTRNKILLLQRCRRRRVKKSRVKKPVST